MTSVSAVVILISPIPPPQSLGWTVHVAVIMEYEIN